MMRMRTAIGFRVLGAAAVAVLVLAASACGGGSSGQTTTAAAGTGTQSTEQWAGSICHAFSTWQSSLASIKSTVKAGQPTKAALQTVDKLHQLPKPLGNDLHIDLLEAVAATDSGDLSRGRGTSAGA